MNTGIHPSTARFDRAGMLVVTFVVLVVVGCADDDTQGEEGSGLRGAVVPAGATAMVNSPLQGSSDFVRELLADGVLTYDEYERAILGYKQCMDALGWAVVREWMPTANHGYASNWYRAADLKATPGAQPPAPAAAGCGEWGMNELSFVWIQTHRPSEQHIQEAREALGACLREHGLDVPEHPAPGLMSGLIRSAGAAAHEAFRVCQPKVEEEFDLPGFSG